MQNLARHLPDHLDPADVRDLTAFALSKRGGSWMKSFRIVSVGQHDDEGTLYDTAETLSQHRLTATGDEDVNDADWEVWLIHVDATLAALGWRLVYPDDIEPGCMIELARID